MRASEIREMTDADLASRIAELERERFNLRFKSGTQPLDDPLRLRAVRKDLARLRTIARERQIGVTRPEAAPQRAAAPAKRPGGRARRTSR